MLSFRILKFELIFAPFSVQAAAIEARDLDIHGSIPCEGCEHLAFDQPIYEMKGADAALLDPER